LLEPLGQSQIFAYLKDLSKKNKIFLLTYEKKEFYNIKNREDTEKNIRMLSNLIWIPIKYHKYPLGVSSLWDISKGVIISLLLLKKNKIEIIHSRSFVPGIIASIVKSIIPVKFIFDIRGFWVDEKVNSNRIKRSDLVFKILKQVEKLLFIHADYIVALTDSAKKEIKSFPYFKNKNINCDVIPTCVDTERFYVKKTDKPLTLGIVGNVSGWALLNPTLDIYTELLNYYPKMLIKILTGNNHKSIEKKIIHKKINLKQVEIGFVSYKNMPQKMQTMDIGVFFYKNSFSEKGRSPTKMAEFLACGIPVIINKGIGDTEEIINKNGIGVVVNGFDKNSIRKASKEIVMLLESRDIAKKCRQIAIDEFSIDIGVARYQQIYNLL
jgi:glycosyltransferase involved in cell wall biosynthesis